MELIKAGTNIDFIRHAKRAAIFSVSLIVLGLASFWYHGGLNYGVDFAGGTLVHVRFTQPMRAAEIRQALATTTLTGMTVQDFGQGGNEFLIRMPVASEGMDSLPKQVQEGLASQFGEQAFEVRRVETVGPKVGRDLRRKGILAVVFATVMMGAYLAFRFELRFGAGAAVALIHDVLITAGALSLMNMEFDLPVVAALLAVIGYSVNDTVVVCDRIRENMRKLRRDTLATIINKSINETLSRTLITGGTSLMVLLALFILGGSVIHAFAFVLLVGLTIGTYSSIYVASPIILLWEKERGRRRR